MVDVDVVVEVVVEVSVVEVVLVEVVELVVEVVELVVEVVELVVPKGVDPVVGRGRGAGAASTSTEGAAQPAPRNIAVATTLLPFDSAFSASRRSISTRGGSGAFFVS
ncbi:MAG: hypothetical protein AAF560_04445 [Acidobacteriota bacterium]